MNEIAIIICNYNGGLDTLKCIDAVLQSHDVQYDIYVIDNASTDDSVKRIEERYGDSVAILQNTENLGGSGGFGRGLRMAVEKNYPYIMMLDNDAYVDTNTIKGLYDYLLDNPNVGVVGAKIMDSDEPQRIMDFAKRIDFNAFTDASEWCGQLDSEEASVPLECDFVAATAAMVRREVLLRCGGMDEAHFIYYDDIELCYRIKQYGYRIVALGSVKAWHKSGQRQKRSNTFARYYFGRNRYRFFAKYIQENDIERLTEHVLSRAFAFLYGAHYKGRMDIFDTEKYILEDFLRDRRGKAGERRVNELQADGYRGIEEVLAGVRKACLFLCEGATESSVAKLCSRLWQKEPGAEVLIAAVPGMQEMAEACRIRLTAIKPEKAKGIRMVGTARRENVDRVIYLCGHVKDMTDNILPDICIDSHDNLIAEEQDYLYFRNYGNSYAFFRALQHDSVVEAIHRIREERAHA